MGPPVGKHVEFGLEALKHPFNILAHVAVRKADRGIPTMLVQSISCGIFNLVVCVAVDLYDQSFLWTEEVYDGIADHVLAAKLVTTELRAAEIAPEFGFEGREVLPEALRPIEKMRVLLQQCTPPLPLP